MPGRRWSRSGRLTLDDDGTLSRLVDRDGEPDSDLMTIRLGTIGDPFTSYAIEPREWPDFLRLLDEWRDAARADERGDALLGYHLAIGAA